MGFASEMSVLFSFNVGHGTAKITLNTCEQFKVLKDLFEPIESCTFYCGVNLETTVSCSFDNLQSRVLICKQLLCRNVKRRLYLLYNNSTLPQTN